MDKPTLRLLIRERLADGRLSHDRFTRVWSGPGNGEICYGCGEMVTKGQMAMGGLDAMGRGAQFHVACLYLWEVERSVPALARQDRDFGERRHVRAAPGAEEKVQNGPVSVWREGHRPSP
jgi:hypothetical protein